MTEIVEVAITDVAHGGRFVGRSDEMVVFVRGALPGELVRARVMKKRKKLWLAVAEEILEPSEHRVEPLWPDGAAGVTGAADLSHADLAYQRLMKAHVIRSNARRIGGAALGERLADLTVAGVDDGDGWHTRTRYDVVKMDTGAGMYREQSHDLVRLDSQPLAVADLERLGVFTDAWDQAIAPGTRMHVVAPASGENVVVTDEGTFTAPGKKAADSILETASTRDDVWTYELSSSGFWQIHYRAPSELLQLVLDGAQVSPGNSVLELFSGAGLFSVPLASAVGKNGSLRTIEGSRRAVADAEANLERYSWASPRSGRIDTKLVVPELPGTDVVVADPPRAGLGAELAEEIAKSQANRVVLVSCDPAAMARDAGALFAQRELESVHARDIFPHTHHVEIVSVFGPRRATAPSSQRW